MNYLEEDFGEIQSEPEGKASRNKYNFIPRKIDVSGEADVLSSV